jgi:hypothetical protein
MYPKAFLTNGHRWIIFDENNNTIFDKDFPSSKEMIQELGTLIGLGAIIAPVKFPYAGALQIGLSMNRSGQYSIAMRQSSSGNPSAAVSWDYEKYSDPIVKDFVQELNLVANENRNLLKKDIGQKSLMVKDRSSDNKLIEYWPGDNTVYNTKNNHLALRISEDLRDRYYETVMKVGKPLTDVKRITILLREIVAELVKKRNQ